MLVVSPDHLPQTQEASPAPDPLAPVGKGIRWRLVWGVVALQTALQLGWMIYRAYQPALLSAHGFAALLPAFSLLPGLLGLVIEPASGWTSDRWEAARRGRLLPISVAVLVAGMIFLSVVGLLNRGIPAGSLLLPVLMVGWVAAVQAASSPSLALLNDASALRALPQVAALVTLGHGLIGALEPTITKGALKLGPSLTFLLGAMVLGLGLGLLRSVTPSPDRSRVGSLPVSGSPPWGGGVLLLSVIGAGVGVLSGTILTLLPRVQAGLGEGSAPVVLLVSAITAPWVGRLASRWGARRSLRVGIGALAVGLALALWIPGALLPLLLPGLGLLLALVSTSQTAIALGTLPAGGGGFGSGLVMGAGGAAGSLLIVLFGREGTLSLAPVMAAMGMATALALTATTLLPLTPPSGHPTDRHSR